MGFLSGLIGSAANFGLDQMSNSVNSKRQQFYNERNMELQHEYQKKMVDYVAEKNEPRKAVARWRAAGIAPETVFQPLCTFSQYQESLSEPVQSV
jgi:hypothetical protein